MSMTELANRFKTDKGTVEGDMHAYSCVYDLLFGQLRDKKINIMEVGLNMGGPELGYSPDRKPKDVPSIRMWQDYFPMAKLFGVDISDFSHFQSEKFSFFRADCGNENDLDQVVATAPQCDIIIDDGSHASFHQQLTLFKLFNILKPGGLYIIEDLHWQPAEYERQLPVVPKTRDVLLNMFLCKELPSSGAFKSSQWNYLRDNIENLMLFREEDLQRMGLFYNKNRNLNGNFNYDDSLNPRLLSGAHLRKMVGKCLDLVRYAFGFRSPMRMHIRLAVLQKRM